MVAHVNYLNLLSVLCYYLLRTCLLFVSLKLSVAERAVTGSIIKTSVQNKKRIGNAHEDS